jgi:hypothetical protein
MRHFKLNFSYNQCLSTQLQILFLNNRNEFTYYLAEILLYMDDKKPCCSQYELYLRYARCEFNICGITHIAESKHILRLFAAYISSLQFGRGIYLRLFKISLLLIRQNVPVRYQCKRKCFQRLHEESFHNEIIGNQKLVSTVRSRNNI